MKSAFHFIVCGLACCICSFACHAAHTEDFAFSEMTFRKIEPADRVPLNYVEAIEQDENGLIWIGTIQGLYRYDGYRAKAYRADPDSPGSIVDNSIRSLFVDQKQRMWVGTQRGVSRYEPATESFTNYLDGPNWAHGSLSNRVNAFVHDSKGRVVASTEAGFLYRYDESLDSFQRLNLAPFGYIKSLICDPLDRFWVGVADEVICYDHPKRQISRYRNTLAMEAGITNDFVNALYFQNENRIWVGTSSHGVLTLNPETQSFRQLPSIETTDKYTTQILELTDHTIAVTSNSSICRYTRDGALIERITKESGNGDIPHTGISLIYIDSQNSVWIGSQFEGISASVQRKPFYHHAFHDLNPSVQPNSPVAAMLLDRDGNFWIADSRSGLYLYPADGSPVITFTNDPHDDSTITSQPVLRIFQDSSDTIWIGTYRGGLHRYLPESRSFQTYYVDPKSSDSISSQDVRDLAEDEEGNLWINAHGNGIDYFNTKTGKFANYNADSNDPGRKITDNWAWTIFYDSEGNLWVGTPTGISVINRKSNTVRNYRADDNDPTSLSSDEVKSITQDIAGRIWIGTENGLNQYLPASDSFVHFTISDGLPNHSIESIVEDDAGNLWLGTWQGLSKFDPETKTFLNYFESDGLPSHEFFTGSAFKAPDGRLYFGTLKGLVSFLPDEIKPSAAPIEVLLTDIFVFNKPLPIQPDSKKPGTLSESILHLDNVSLDWTQKVVTFNFIALDFHHSSKIKYTYRLDGFDTDWSPPTSNRSVTYTNLNPGDYQFRIKASNSDGFWNEAETNLALTVLPPFWQTPWFISLGVVGIIFFPSLFVYLRTTSLKRYQRELELAVEDRTLELNQANRSLEKAYQQILSAQDLLEDTVMERTRELEIAKSAAEQSDRLKSAFLANMSHEIRTPMNAIVGFLHFLDSDDLQTAERKRLTQIINQSSDTLLALIDDILDLSTIEAGEATIEPISVNLRELCEQLYTLYRANAKSKSNTDLILHFDDRDIRSTHSTSHSIVDPIRLKQILANLIGNAIKFTENGEIVFGCRIATSGEHAQDPKVIFTVEDTGVGIPEDQLGKIFDRFHKVEKDKRKIYRGTGLGLTISRKLAELMDGTIAVESELGSGTTFTLTLPYIPDEQPKTSTKQNASDNCSPDESPPDWSHLTILVAEDEIPNFEYIKKSLDPTNAKILWAENGEQALTLFSSTQVDLILLDLKMPKLDGFETAKRIRYQDTEIPIIVQSAYAMRDEIEQSQRAGANAHLAKPFSPSSLINKISAHLTNSAQPADRSHSTDRLEP